MSISRRNALMGACAAVAVAGVPRAVQGDNPRLEDIQALVCDLRNVDGKTIMAVWVAFHEVADRLEALPGIEPVPSEGWRAFRSKHHERPTALEWPIGPYLSAGRA